MSEADEDSDGKISYKEFAPLMLEVMHGLKAKHADLVPQEHDARRSVLKKINNFHI